MTFRIIALTGLIAVGTLVSQQGVMAGNESRYRAYALSDDRFEVVAEFSENAIYWCGASLFARTLTNDITRRVFVVQGPSPSRSEPNEVAVTFGLTPPSGAEAYSGFSNSVKIVGNSRSISDAQGGCTERSSSG